MNISTFLAGEKGEDNQEQQKCLNAGFPRKTLLLLLHIIKRLLQLITHVE